MWGDNLRCGDVILKSINLQINIEMYLNEIKYCLAWLFELILSDYKLDVLTIPHGARDALIE